MTQEGHVKQSFVVLAVLAVFGATAARAQDRRSVSSAGLNLANLSVNDAADIGDTEQPHRVRRRPVRHRAAQRASSRSSRKCSSASRARSSRTDRRRHDRSSITSRCRCSRPPRAERSRPSASLVGPSFGFRTTRSCRRRDSTTRTMTSRTRSKSIGHRPRRGRRRSMPARWSLDGRYTWGLTQHRQDRRPRSDGQEPRASLGLSRRSRVVRV